MPNIFRANWKTFYSGGLHKTALCRQCGCRVCLAIKELHIPVQLTEQQSERVDEDEIVGWRFRLGV